MRVYNTQKIIKVLIITLCVSLVSFVSLSAYEYLHPEEKRSEISTEDASPSPDVLGESDEVAEVSPSPSSKPNQAAGVNSPALATSPTPTVSQDGTVQNSDTSVASPTPTASNNSSTPPAPQKLHVSVSIDGLGSFTVSVDEGKNHCDVLSQALQDGKISNLNMQYNSAYSSNAVYIINNLGEANQVWWGYKVNGKSPPLGCSHVLVQSNDAVEWTYVGPK